MKCDKCVNKGHCRFDYSDYPEYMREVMVSYCKRFEEPQKQEINNGKSVVLAKNERTT